MSSVPLFTGVYPFLATPFTPDGEKVDAVRLATHIDELIRVGKVHGITALGSTGEFALMSDSERQLVAETTIAAVKKRVPAVIGTAAIATKTAVALSKHAERAGADAIIVNPQSYWLPTEDELFDHYAAIARAVSIPVMVYNNPGTTKIDMSPKFIARLNREFSHFVSVKESTGDIRRVQNILELTDGKMSVSIGHQSLGLAAFAVGATGWTTGIANTIPELCVQVFDEVVNQKNLDKGRQTFRRMLPLCDFYAEKSLCRSVKAAADIMGKPLGSPRLPLKRLSAADYKTLERLLVECGVLKQAAHA
jgi:Dihydrodipicolinate synthase/N-acetylneuraminate lyase